VTTTNHARSPARHARMERFIAFPSYNTIIIV
jgi:hypothetical protein